MTDLPQAAETAPQRCAACGALRSPTIGWCPQCYARFETPSTADEPETPSTADEPETPSTAQEAATWDAANRAGDGLAPEVEARVQELMAQLQAGEPRGGRLHSLSSRLSGTGTKYLVIVVGMVALGALGFGLMSLLGRLL